jgi:glycogen debranching enzyme
MPVEVKVGPAGITISQDRTFMVTDERGEIDPSSEQGLFAGDTRFVSFYKLYINDERWDLLTASAVSYYAARLHFANPAIRTDEGEIPPHALSLTMTRTVSDGVHEDLDITSYAPGPVSFQVQIGLLSDFADLFEVKHHRFVRRGRAVTRWNASRRNLATSYTNGDFHRRLVFQLRDFSSPPEYANGRVVFDITLQPGESWHTCAHYTLVEGARARQPLYTCNALSGADTSMDRLQREWRDMATRLTSSNEDVYRAYSTSVGDMGALRLYDEDFAPDVWLPAAGVPWFVTVFGRDSLIVSLQNMLVYPPLARGALEKLAEYQAKEFDDWRDAQPGKMPHELRTGELAHFHRIPHTPYYGTADATILYLIALHEAWKWLGDDSLLRQHRDVALKCLQWIDQHGDLDGDGFQEYRARGPLGYENQSWKDAHDAIVYPDGTQVPQPKAVCELQGYVFDAKMRMAEAFRALGEPERAARLAQEAAELQRKFEAAFWCEEIGCYALTLDPDKRPVATVASNAGHCLWSGIARPDHAARVVQRFLEGDMWSGWGIRTLSARHPAYNPFSYQLGSVWPHDNGIIALGFKRYGFAAEASRVARDILEAASFHPNNRLPELYAGLPRGASSFPVQYAGANIPQAWAAGSVFHLLQAILGLQADAPHGRLYVHPTLPRWLRDLTLAGLRVGPARLTLRFWREGEESRWSVCEQEGDIEVVEQPWGPWDAEGASGTPATAARMEQLASGS